MNKIFLIITGFMVILIMPGCTKSFLEQTNPNSVPVSANYQTENDVIGGLMGCYQAIRSSNCKGESAQIWTDERSDDVNITDNQSNNGEPFQFSAFSLVPSNTYLYSHWSALYAPISRANLLLSVINTTAITYSSDSARQQYIAELKFIRAMMYFDLVREFGGVPLVTDKLNNTQQVTALTYRETRENVYSQIVKDLTDVVNSKIPVVQSAANKGRVSLQAANALLGQVYLTMGTTISTSSAATNFANAKTYLLACYNMRTFNNLSDIPYTDVFNVAKKQTCPEIILQIPYLQGDANYSSSLAANDQAKGETINSQFVSTGAGYPLTNDLLNEFETGDIRTSFSIKFAANPAVNAYFVTKFRDASSAAGPLGYGGNDWILIRYADVILNLAEVSLYLNDNASAITYLNMVRARAGMPDYATMLNNPAYAASFPTLKLAILHERRVELCFEHHRWHDLLRFFNITDLVAYFHAKSQANYNNCPLTNFTIKDEYFPIPLTEFNLNPTGMAQNPGY